MKLINAIKATKALEFGDFVLKSGQKSNFYLDLRRLSLSGYLKIIIEELWELTRHLTFDAIGGPSIGADPIVGGYLALKAHEGLRGFLVRKEEKTHGKSGLIIGSVEPGDRCIMVEDVTTTGGSLLGAVNAVEDFGAKVITAITVVDRVQGAEEEFNKRKIPFYSLLTIDQIT